MRVPELSTLSIDVTNHIAKVALNRPGKANSMNAAMWDELEVCFKWLDSEPEVRVVILYGEGKHFCAGIDLAMFGDLANTDAAEAARRAEMLRQKILSLQGNLSAIEQCRKPVLAAIHYTCIGGGIDMIACCDMRYCTADAYFSIKEIDIGMTADVGTLQRLPYIIGDGQMRELAYTGRTVAADEALSLGLVNQVYQDREQMLAAVTEIASNIAAKSPLAVRGTKEMLLYSRDHSVQDSLNYMATWNAGMLSMSDVFATAEATAKGDVPGYDD
ncbi:crotonase/enoyl-CoA hydratase family protein [Oceanicoccus sagamiensis]|uniref:Enoyl-CoA hydratase n=1 Tax=Oceanicoccus sagamiensis TaxID=716816 RepID=A0A1X9NG84_9GAMM|nr:crotonase/enoyl-CoA hydratase family protein [Oceanicoccus sagamiensis]ARN76506.1 enoyl-CoA hydratase [Oceanicoccus sagamiensis]